MNCDLLVEKDSLEKRIYDIQNVIEKEELYKILKSQEETSGTTLITLYYDKLDHNIFRLVEKEENQNQNIKDKKTKNTVESGIKTLKNLLRALYHKKGFDVNQACAIFVKGDFGVVAKVPTSHLKSRKEPRYRCGKKFYIAGLETSIGPTWGLIVLDTQGYSIGVFRNNRIETLNQTSVDWIPNRMRAGGQSSVRFAQSRANLVKLLAENVSLEANSCFQNYEDISKILIGGIVPTSEVFMNYNMLKKTYKDISEGVTCVTYTTKEGLVELVEKNRQKYKQSLQLYEKELKKIEEFFESIKDRTKVRTKEQIKNLLGVELPKKVFTRNTYNKNDYYCFECKVLTDKEFQCGHKLHHLKNLELEFYTIDISSLNGLCFDECLKSYRTEALFCF